MVNRIYWTLIFCLTLSWQSVGAVCETVENQAPSGFVWAEDKAAMAAHEAKKEALLSALGLQLLPRVSGLGAWRLVQFTRSQTFFEGCRPQTVAVAQQEEKTFIKLYPVLQSSQAPGLVAPQQFAIVVPEIVVKMHNMDKLPKLEKKYDLVQKMIFPKVQLVFYEVSEQQDLDEILQQLANEIGVASVKPVLQRKRYHLR